MTEFYSPMLIQKVTAAELDFAVVPAFMGGRGLKVQHFLRTWETLVAGPDKKMHLGRTRLRDVGPLKIVYPATPTRGESRWRHTSLPTEWISSGSSRWTR